MRASVHHKMVRVYCPDGGVMEFRRLGDHGLSETPRIVKTTAPRYVNLGFQRALKQLEQEHWGTR